MKKLSAKEWSARGGWHPSVKLLGEFSGASAKIQVKCLECGRTWSSLPGNLLKQKRCRVCSRKSTAEKLRARKPNKVEAQPDGSLRVDISTRSCPNAFMRIDPAGWEKIRALNSRVSKSGNYAVFYSTGGRSHLVHRELCPGAKYVDHANGDGLDNRADNLRRCSAPENGSNRRRRNKNNTSGVPGVRFRSDTGKWSASLMRCRKNYSLGCFDSFRAAKRARKKAEASFFGEFKPEIK